MILDAIDKQILNLLQQNSKANIKEVALKIGLTQTPTYERIKRLEKLGVIQKYVAVLNKEKVGYTVEVFCQVSLLVHSKDLITKFEIAVNKIDEVIECFHVAGNYDYLLKVIVKDNGKGIDKDKLKIIFKAYAQEKINTSRQYGGTGLGLAICDLIIKLMEGNIQVNSNPKGTEFSFEIPMQIVKKLSIKDPKQYDLQVNNINILMAEDDELNGQLFKNLIQDSKNNIKVDWVKNGIEVMERITEKSYQIILMDIEMPLKNGFETSQLIRKHKDQKLINIPIIAMTAHLVEDVLQKCYESGMNDCISKPFKLDFLYKN